MYQALLSTQRHDVVTLTDRHLSLLSDFSSEEDITPCGHCDNCIRDPALVVEKDVTSEAKRVLAVARALASRNTNFTALQLAETARGKKSYQSHSISPQGT